MTERERLIELIEKASMQEAFDAVFSSIDDVIDMAKGKEYLADYLLENGVIVPPCKVGDTIWRCGIERVHYWQIQSIDMYVDEIVFVDDSDNYFTEDDIGKTVFLTKEEAEQVLKGGEG